MDERTNERTMAESINNTKANKAFNLFSIDFYSPQVNAMQICPIISIQLANLIISMYIFYETH